MAGGTLARGHYKLSDELIDRAYGLACMGLPIRSIAKGVGCSYEAFYRWLKQAETEQATQLELQLLQAMRQGSLAFEARHVANITKHSETDHRASTWLLSHSTFTRDQWSDSAQVKREVAKVVGMFVEVLQLREDLSQEQREGILLDLRAKGLAVEVQELPLE